MPPLVEFLALGSTSMDFGDNMFIEVERRRKTDGKRKEDYLLIIRGFYEHGSGRKRRRAFVTLPDDPTVKEFVTRALGDV